MGQKDSDRAAADEFWSQNDAGEYTKTARRRRTSKGVSQFLTEDLVLARDWTFGARDGRRAKYIVSNAHNSTTLRYSSLRNAPNLSFRCHSSASECGLYKGSLGNRIGLPLASRIGKKAWSADFASL